MSCVKCDSGVWVCGPDAADECDTIPNIVVTDRDPDWYYMGQKELTAGRWYVSCQPGCRGVTVSEADNGTNDYVDIPEDAWYILLCKKGGQTQGCNTGLVKTGI